MKNAWKLTTVEIGVAVGLIALSVMVRLWWPMHLAPVAASALFAGYFFRSRWLALAVPLGAMALSDALIGYYNVNIMAAVYAGLCFPVLLSGLLRKEVSVARLVGCSLAASVAFFLISNGAEWVFGSLYAKTASGLEQCFTMALPFFRNTLMSDLVWTSILFAAHGLIASRLRLSPPDDYGTLAPVRVRK